MVTLGPDYWRPDGLAKHTAVRPKGLILTDEVLDVGAGIRPMQLWTPKRHLCVEPFGPYADRLEAAGYEVVRETAQRALTHLQADTVMLLDVIEHMERGDGVRVIALAIRAARRQVVVFTPHGWKEQTEDAWGMGGDEWQTHRSAWHHDSDFAGWTITPHGRNFFAIYTHA